MTLSEKTCWSSDVRTTIKNEKWSRKKYDPLEIPETFTYMLFQCVHMYLFKQ